MTIPLCLALLAAEPPKEQASFFENKVRPLLVEKCFGCHSAAQKKSKGGLQLDSRDAFFKGGDPSVAGK